MGWGRDYLIPCSLFPVVEWGSYKTYKMLPAFTKRANETTFFLVDDVAARIRMTKCAMFPATTSVRRRDYSASLESSDILNRIMSAKWRELNKDVFRRFVSSYGSV